MSAKKNENKIAKHEISSIFNHVHLYLYVGKVILYLSLLFDTCCIVRSINIVLLTVSSGYLNSVFIFNNAVVRYHFVLTMKKRPYPCTSSIFLFVSSGVVCCVSIVVGILTCSFSDNSSYINSKRICRYHPILVSLCSIPLFVKKDKDKCKNDVVARLAVPAK
jgi:hypothetical protein